MKLKLLRHSYLADRILGVLLIDDMFYCYTLELPYLDNQKNISCIPNGLYLIKNYKSKKHGRCLAVPSVYNRSGILMHKGNRPADTQGCILVGKGLANNDDLKDSKIAMNGLLDLFYEMGVNSTSLEVCTC